MLIIKYNLFYFILTYIFNLHMFIYASSSSIGNYEHYKIVSCYSKVNLQPTT